MSEIKHADINAAIVAAQAEIPRVSFDSTNPFLKNRYASLGAVIEAARPILARHGLAVVQFSESDGPQVGIRTTIVHESGGTFSGRIMIDVGEEKGKSRAQVAGSIVTYLRRYSLASALGMYADEDTDGQAPSSPAPRTPAAAQKPPATAPAAKPAVRTPPEAAKPPTEAPKATEATKKWFLSQVAKVDQFVDYARTAGVLLPNESLEDWPLDQVPTTRGDLSAMLEECVRWRSGQAVDSSEPPGEPEPPVAPLPIPPLKEGEEDLIGIIKKINEKEYKPGKWRFGILIVNDPDDREEKGSWVNTFSSTDGELAKSLEGQLVRVRHTTSKFGLDLVEHCIWPHVEDVTP